MAALSTKKDAPSRNLSPAHVAKMSRVLEERKESALGDDHVIKVHYGYKKQKALWAESDEDQRHGSDPR